jgi:MFS family permease
MTEVADKGDVFRHAGFVRFWTASTVSDFGTYITTLAIQVLVVLTLHGTATDVGLVNAARWLPYLLLGLVAGALVDRRPRRPVLVVSDLGRGLLLAAIPVLWWADVLTVAVVVVFMAVFGLLSLANDAAFQSYLPRLVPSSELLAANARLDQSASVAQTSGPVVAGALVGWLGAPVAVLVDAVSYVVSGVAIASIKVSATVVRSSEALPSLRREIGAGLRWVYGHQMLAPMAITTHAWFLFNAMVGTVHVPYALVELDLSPFVFGVTMAAAGAGGLLGSLLATRVGLAFGAGRTAIVSQALAPLAWALIALAPSAQDGQTGMPAVVLVMAGQFVFGLSIGVENANTLGYRQAVTPDELQGRMNITMRSINRAMIVFGAPLGGLLAEAIGNRQTLWIGVAGFTAVAVALAVSPFRNARHSDAPPSG